MFMTMTLRCQEKIALCSVRLLERTGEAGRAVLHQSFCVLQGPAQNMAFGLFSVPPRYPPPRPEGLVGWLQSDSLVLAIRWVCRFLSASPLSFLWVPCPPRSPSGQLEGHCGAWDSAGSREKAEGGTHWHLSLLTLHEFWYSRGLGRAYLAGVFLASSQMQSKKKERNSQGPSCHARLFPFAYWLMSFPR